MDFKDSAERNAKINAQKTKTLTSIGCFGVVVIIILVLLFSTWTFLGYLFTPQETQFMVSESPNEKNQIEFLKVDEFPTPTLKIKYDNRSITKPTIVPKLENLAVEWRSNQEAVIILKGKGEEVYREEITFK